MDTGKTVINMVPTDFSQATIKALGGGDKASIDLSDPFCGQQSGNNLNPATPQADKSNRDDGAQGPPGVRDLGVG